jgi:X-Pro dipeptidyl-peptidase
VSLRFRTPLRPGRWYTVTVPFNAYDVTVAAGHTLGLVLTQSDPQFTEAPDTGATVTVDLAASRLTLPVTGRATLSPAPAGAEITTAPAAPAERRTDDYRRQLPR